MPGKHSAEKLAIRRARAIDRGFLVPRPPEARHILVPEAIAGRVKAVVASMDLQASHIDLSGKPATFARQATREARTCLHPTEYKQAMLKHDKANVAKHCWSDVSDSELPAPSSPMCGALLDDSIPPCSSSSPPMCGAYHSVGCQTDCGVHHEVGCQTDEYCDDAIDINGSSGVWSFPPWYAYQHLFEAQNQSIGLLCSRIHECLPANRRVTGLERKLGQLEKDIESLRTSLSSTVNDRFSDRIDGCLPTLVAKLNEVIVPALITKLNDIIPNICVPIIDAKIAAVADHPVDFLMQHRPCELIRYVARRHMPFLRTSLSSFSSSTSTERCPMPLCSSSLPLSREHGCHVSPPRSRATSTIASSPKPSDAEIARRIASCV